MSTAVTAMRARGQADPAAGRRCVLLVEDDDDLRSMVATALGAADVDVVLAADALGAREQLRSGRVDAVLLDIRLPGLSGLHVCREIRRAPATAHLPVIMMTGDARPDVVRAGERAGATAYLVKPLYVRDLLLALNAAWAAGEHV